MTEALQVSNPKQRWRLMLVEVMLVVLTVTTGDHDGDDGILVMLVKAQLRIFIYALVNSHGCRRLHMCFKAPG